MPPCLLSLHVIPLFLPQFEDLVCKNTATSVLQRFDIFFRSFTEGGLCLFNNPLLSFFHIFDNLYLYKLLKIKP